MREKLIISIVLTMLLGIAFAGHVSGQSEVKVIRCGYTNGGSVTDCTSAVNSSGGTSQDVAKNYRLNLNFSEPLRNGDKIFINITSAVAKFVNLTVCDFDVGCNVPNYGWVYVPMQAGLYNISLNLTTPVLALSINSPIEQTKGVDHIYATLSDNSPPNFSNYLENPANSSAYSPSQIYRFNVTVADENLQKVWMEFNNINYTTTNSSNRFTFSISNLGAGTYSYKWWANDSYGNLNNSGTRYYTINKATPILTFLANSQLGNLTMNYPSQVNISAKSDYGTVSLDKDSASYLINNGVNVTLSAGSYIFRANITGNQNYSDRGYSYYNITITKANPSLSSSLTPGIVYGTASNYQASENNNGDGDCMYNLYRNSFLISSGSIVSDNSILAAGSYNYVYNTTGCSNYSNASDSKVLTVSKAENNPTLLSSVGWNINYGTEITFNCYTVFGNPKMYLNNQEVNNPSILILPEGSYDIKCNISESQNYSAGLSQGNMIVNKAISQVSLTFDKTSPKDYGMPITPTCTRITGEGNPILRINENIIISGQAIALGVGIWNFNCSLAGSQNYTSSESISNFVISLASTNTQVITSPSSPIAYGEYSNFSCSNSQGLSTSMSINGEDKTSEIGLSILRASGNYAVNCTSLENQNYSGSSQQSNYVINKAAGSIRLFLNGLEENLTIDYPQQHNITALTSYGSVIIYKDGEDITSENGVYVAPFRTAAYYNVTAESSGNQNYSSSSITRWLNVTLDILPPILIIDSPQEGASYGYNNSLQLNFSVADSHLDSCWYNLNSGENITIANCENITFNASADGIYGIYVYANDTLGNLAVKNSTFSVLVGAPTILLNSPIGIYLNANNITFRYVPSDLDLTSCELWGDFTGEFKLNQTNNSPINNLENSFSLNLPDRAYTWNIACNDSQGHYALNGNKTFYVDTKSPKVSIIEPVGTKTSMTEIPLQYLINDSSPTICRYNIQWSTGGTVIPNTSIANCASTTLNVPALGSYVLNLLVTDFAGNFNSSISNFSVSNSPQVSPPQAGDGGSSGGGGGVSNATYSKQYSLEIGILSDLVINPGESRKMSLSVKNAGRSFLNLCKIKNAGWISSDETRDLSPGQISEFSFTLNVPLEMEEKRYSVELNVECKEFSSGISFNAESIKKKIAITLINAKREGDKLRISYSLEELSGREQNINVEILLFDKDKRVAEAKEKRSISANSKGSFEAIIDAPEGIDKFNLLINANSDSGSAFLQEEILLGNARISGLAIFGSENGDRLVILLITVSFMVCSFFIIKRVIKLRRMAGLHRNKERRLKKLSDLKGYEKLR